MPSSTSSSAFTCALSILVDIFPREFRLLELKSIFSMEELEKPMYPIKFSGTRLRCIELEEKIYALIQKLSNIQYHFKDDVYDAMSSLRQHEQMLCELEEYISLDLPAKEEFLNVNCTNMRNDIRNAMQQLQSKLNNTFDASTQAKYVLRPLRRKVKHARKLTNALRYQVYMLNDWSHVSKQIEVIKAMITDAETHGLQLDCEAFNYGRDLLMEGREWLNNEWKEIRRDLRQLRRATGSSSPSSSSSHSSSYHVN
ncbi:hypothetical protein THRCLA_01640 [Thraustotheca clavata]|uniref:Uncharacterized protein n=1 Tax=Thraustotheca clavata TaxID=74557 RepID=A0A1W0A7X2_9STRA|nr:hypothetical protein THRCLA_01640 [Thraustotheca clavata]